MDGTSQPTPPSSRPDIVVFLGSTLPVAEAEAILPACYLPPARCGDVLRALRNKPRVLLLIDGLFERVSAVWHKELLLALQQGVWVLGASSMGALRAAELAPLGMIGIGTIFERYHAGVYTDDDEVAVAHSDAEHGYASLSEALVNLRATLERATRESVIQAGFAARVLAHAKATFYPQRSLLHSVQALDDGDADPQQGAALLRFAQCGGYVDQKRMDAVAALHAARSLVETASPRPPQAEPSLRSIFFQKLHLLESCRPFDRAPNTLCRSEQIVRAASTLGERYALLQRIAMLSAACHAVALSEAAQRGPASDGHPDPNRDVAIAMPSGQEPARWAEENDLTPAELGELLSRISRIAAFVGAAVRAAAQPESEIQRYQLTLSRIHGEHPQDAAASLAHRALYRRAAILFFALDQRILQAGLTGQPGLQAFSESFRRERGLEKASATAEWLRQNGIGTAEFSSMLAAYHRLMLICESANLHLLGAALSPAEGGCWFLDALRMTGVYVELRRSLGVESERRAEPGHG